ncbi:hypothetical protein X975_19257, partial [Stegodyphus mimosarum]
MESIIIHERGACRGGSICVWDGISFGGCTGLHIFPHGTMNAYMPSSAGAMSYNFLLQDDNTKLLRARIMDNHLQHMEKPAQSLDLNPIKHVWDALERHITALNPPLQTLATLAKRLSLPIKLIECIIVVCVVLLLGKIILNTEDNFPILN